MLTDKQEKWLEHLSDTNKTVLNPFNTKVLIEFISLKKKLQKILGRDTAILLKGSSSLGISGKGELDVYIPVSRSDFDSTFGKLESVIGQPGSYYPYEGVRFNLVENKTQVELFLINAESWKQLNIFEDWLRCHPEDLQNYEKIKVSLVGKSTQEYYKKKLIFFNTIIEKSTSQKC